MWEDVDAQFCKYKNLPLGSARKTAEAGVPHGRFGIPDDLAYYAEQFCEPYMNRPDLNLPCVLGSNNHAAARSQHTGGVNTLFGDGSARFIVDSVDAVYWQSLTTIAGGEILEDS